MQALRRGRDRAAARKMKRPEDERKIQWKDPNIRKSANWQYTCSWFAFKGTFFHLRETGTPVFDVSEDVNFFVEELRISPLWGQDGDAGRGRQLRQLRTPHSQLNYETQFGARALLVIPLTPTVTFPQTANVKMLRKRSGSSVAASRFFTDHRSSAASEVRWILIGPRSLCCGPEEHSCLLNNLCLTETGGRGGGRTFCSQTHNSTTFLWRSLLESL